jgi:hypothetical protein
MTITNFLVLLSDCFETQINSGETHTALLASTSAGGQKRKTQPPPKNVTTQEKTAPSTTAELEGLEHLSKRVKDFHSILCQVQATLKEIQEDRISKGKGKRTRNDRDDRDDRPERTGNQGRFRRDGAARNQSDKQYAAKAQKKKTQKSVNPRHSSDSSMSDSDDDGGQQYAKLARVHNGRMLRLLKCETVTDDTPVFSLYGKVPDDLDVIPTMGTHRWMRTLTPSRWTSWRHGFETYESRYPTRPLYRKWRGILGPIWH